MGAQFLELPGPSVGVLLGVAGAFVLGPGQFREAALDHYQPGSRTCRSECHDHEGGATLHRFLAVAQHPSKRELTWGLDRLDARSVDATAVPGEQQRPARSKVDVRFVAEPGSQV